MRQKPYLIWLGLLACLVGFILISILVAGHKTVPFDSMIAGWVQSCKSPSLLVLAHFLAKIGEPRVVVVSAIVVTVLGIAAAAVFKAANIKLIVAQLTLFVAVNLLSYVSEPFIKGVFERPRPLPNIGSFSFPSGHALMAFAFCITGAYLISKHLSSRAGRNVVIGFAVMFTVIMGLSRIYLKMHYATDVIAGFLLSGFFLAFLVLLFRRFKVKV